ncbi:hypothetical protein [Phyllobacterium leguminum]|uniref:Uncharacterized protein n=1 Tax=Phyllobacterium leguminum TaxID=314237 RepID=A0A318TJR6_9HYPH|nr:hypothetical protein [Phyllobacterium leguminum]PYE89530.1 hypothetical protein C7477_10337 [Phyllobacterium leguminum]
MNNEAFLWDTYADQVYTGPSSTQTGYPDAFNKAIGTSFLLDAPNQIVTLSAINTENLDHGGPTWCLEYVSIPAAERTLIDIRNGTLIYSGGYKDGDEFAPIFYLATSPSLSSATYTHIRVSNEGCFQIRDTVTAWAKPDSSIVLEATSHGVIDMELVEEIEVNVKEINILDQARLIIKCWWIALVHGPINITKNAGIFLSSLLASDSGTDAVVFGDTTVTLSENAKGYIEGATFYYGDDVQFTVQDNAEFVFNVGVIAPKIPDSTIRFSLAGAAPKVQINSLLGYPNQPFDFINQTYPEGMFNFVTGAQPNNGKFLIQTNGDHTIPWLVSTRKLIAIDGVPLDPNSDQVDCRIVTDAYLQINLRN